MLFFVLLAEAIDLPEFVALNGARIPSMADEEATERSTPRARAAGLRR